MMPPIGRAKGRAVQLSRWREGACFALDQGHLATYQPYERNAPDSLIPYDEIVQEALRAVVGRVLGEVEPAAACCRATHHFYITFKTGAPGVSHPAHLRERFPDEMTIVLQNKFWDLKVTRTASTVGPQLQPDPGQAEIPFAAITAFVDPAVDFGLQFQAAVGPMTTRKTIEPHRARSISAARRGGAARRGKRP
jgi:uncharacterized protein